MSKKLFGKVFIFLLVVGLLFAAAPKQAQAQTPATLNVAKWSEPASVGVLGRPSVLVDNGTTHLWVGESDQVLYHYQDGKGELVTFETGKEPIECSSVTVIKEGELYYMVTYSTTVLNFSMYQSSDGTNWNHIDQIFLGEDRTGWAKIDAPYLLKDETGYKLYFQMRDVAGKYEIYLATSTILTNRYELAQAAPVLTPDALVPTLTRQ